jgi:branched-chain amino acid transport system ATP-binding protein
MKRLRGEDGLAILLVEQHSAVALDFSPRTVVMNRGRIVYDGDSGRLRADPALLESLVGVAGPARVP